jgi:hypothetical protein
MNMNAARITHRYPYVLTVASAIRPSLSGSPP